MAYNLFMSFMIGLFLLFVFFCIGAYFVNKYEKNKANRNSGPSVFFSNECIGESIYMKHEFGRLVSEIAIHQARLDGKECISDGHSEIPKEKVISADDYEAAFLLAMKELIEKAGTSSSGCGNKCDKESLLKKIRNLRKKYETKTL